MITGSNSGIGKAAAVALAQKGATIVMVCRDAAEGESARLDIIARSGAKSEDVTLMLADLSSLDSVRQLAADFLKNGRKLHVLINNAGLVLGDRRTTKDGLETTFVVNYLSHFLLTNLLLGAVRSAAPSRIINVRLGGPHLGAHRFRRPAGREELRGHEGVPQSKLAQILFTHELARRLQGTGVTVNSLHRGSSPRTGGATRWVP